MLYLICTPIGNLNDLSIRSINTLKDVDKIFSEDTRVASKLLKHFGIHKKTISFHEYNEEEISIKDIATKILDIMKLDGELILKDAPEGSVSRRCPDISLMKKLIQYKPDFSLEEGLKLTLKKFL